MSTYSFNAQLTIGQQGEKRLDQIFGRRFHIVLATPLQQRQGIDRLFYEKTAEGAPITVEYKADSWAGTTGNAFVETVSVDVTGKMGWAYTSMAKLLIYLVVNPETIYCIKMSRLRTELPKWLEQHQVKTVPNQGYRTHGILVPLSEFERIAEEVI